MNDSLNEVTVLDARFKGLISETCVLEKLFTGMRWAEGPVYFADGDYFLCSDIPNDRMMQWIDGLGEREFRVPADHSNGNTRDLSGRLVTCEHGSRSVSRTEYDGRKTVIVDRYRGKKLNSPNDVVVKSDGTVWFTDPTYGIKSDHEGHKSERELDGNYVFRFDPADGTLAIVADDFVQPNGIAFSPDESVMYIADTGATESSDGPRHIRSFRVRDGRRISGGDVFATLTDGLFDGFRLDTAGNVWTSAGAGVNCYAPTGDLLGRISLPETVSNLTFGGPYRNRLFITATTSAYSLFVNARGVV